MTSDRDGETVALLHDDALVADPELQSSETSYTGEETTYGASRPSRVPWSTLTVIMLLTAVQPLAFELIFPFVSELA